MNLSVLLRSGPLNKLSPIVSDIAYNPKALEALDRELMHSAKQTGAVSKFLPTYGKYVAQPASFAGGSLYGKKFDNAKLLATLGGTFGLARYGGEAARPLYGYLHNIGKHFNPEAMKTYTQFAPDSTVNILKPGLAITSKPLAALDSALGGALNLAEHPIIASAALPFAAYGALKGGSALLSRLGRARRLAQLRNGIAPRAYRQQARQLGYK